MTAFTLHPLPDGTHFAEFDDGSISRIWNSREGLTRWAESHAATIGAMQHERELIDRSPLLPPPLSQWNRFTTTLELIETDDDRETLPALVLAYWRFDRVSMGVQHYALMCFRGEGPQMLPAALNEWIESQIEHQARREELLGLSRASAPREAGFGPPSSPSRQTLGVS